MTATFKTCTTSIHGLNTTCTPAVCPSRTLRTGTPQFRLLVHGQTSLFCCSAHRDSSDLIDCTSAGVECFTVRDMHTYNVCLDVTPDPVIKL